MGNQARRSKDGRAGTWIELQKDDGREYGSFWATSLDSEDRRKMSMLDTLKERP